MLTLAHLSDPHIGPLPFPRLRDLAGKRVLGWINWQRGRRDVHRMDVLETLLKDLNAKKADHIALTGDMVNIGLPSEYAAGRALLERIGTTETVSFVPGNHDAYTPGGASRLLSAFDPYMRGDEDGAHPLGEAERFPYLRMRGGVALIGLSSAVPTGLFMATGKLGLRQLTKLKNLLHRLGKEGHCRVVMLHHPVRRQDAGPMAMLLDADKLLDVLREEGAELVIHGHIHTGTIQTIRGPGRPIPVCCVPSASAAPERARWPAAYNFFAIEEAADRWKISLEVRGFGAPGHGVETLRSMVL